MKKVILILAIVFGLLALRAEMVEARVRVRGYTRSSGSYVMPHYRTSPNSYKFDNWSSRGNYNPYSGRSGYKSWY
ncbi:MAG: hypothetical protein COV79_01145 [Parcubacteria group bacterium CG11_big_fil_rev_8_21_14_0_20_41_14]|nr:MAG: hypothetical protein COV79_01145 [Parcubacteria group bacterium CG11_big_fil_rev_8_21_14_0_20_41_14]